MSLSWTNRRRKTLVVFSIICILLTSFVGSVTVSAAGKTTLTASEVKVGKGKTAEVDLNLEENPGIWGLKFKVAYDHSVLKLASVKYGSVFSEEDITPPESLDKESYVFFAASGKLNNIEKTGTVVTLKFDVAEDAELKSYPVTVSVTEAIDASGKDVSIKAEDGNVKVVKSSGSAKDSAVKSDAKDGRENTGTEKEKAQEKTQDIAQNKEDNTSEAAKVKSTGEDETEKGNSKTGIVLVILAVIVAVCVAGVLFVVVSKDKKGRKK